MQTLLHLTGESQPTDDQSPAGQTPAARGSLANDAHTRMNRCSHPTQHPSLGATLELVSYVNKRDFFFSATTHRFTTYQHAHWYDTLVWLLGCLSNHVVRTVVIVVQCTCKKIAVCLYMICKRTYGMKLYQVSKRRWVHVQWRLQETGKGVPNYRARSARSYICAKREKFGVTPTSGAVKLQ